MARISAASQSQVQVDDGYLIALAKQGDHTAYDRLVRRYYGFVRLKASSYFLVGGDSDDLIQEGLVGLYKAIRDYQVEQSASFHTFAELCITRQIISAIKTATRQKQMPLNQSLSLESPSEDPTTDWNLSDILPDLGGSDPEDMVLRNEDTKILHETLQQVLSDFEWHVLSGYQLGKSYREIASELRCKTKSVDNALARIKRKVSGVPIGDADLSELL